MVRLEQQDISPSIEPAGLVLFHYDDQFSDSTLMVAPLQYILGFVEIELSDICRTLTILT